MTVSRYATFSCMEKVTELYGGRKMRSSGLMQKLRTFIVRNDSFLSILVAINKCWQSIYNSSIFFSL